MLRVPVVGVTTAVGDDCDRCWLPDDTSVWDLDPVDESGVKEDLISVERLSGAEEDNKVP